MKLIQSYREPYCNKQMEDVESLNKSKTQLLCFFHNGYGGGSAPFYLNPMYGLTACIIGISTFTNHVS